MYLSRICWSVSQWIAWLQWVVYLFLHTPRYGGLSSVLTFWVVLWYSIWWHRMSLYFFSQPRILSMQSTLMDRGYVGSEFLKKADPIHIYIRGPMIAGENTVIWKYTWLFVPCSWDEKRLICNQYGKCLIICRRRGIMWVAQCIWIA